LVRALCSRMAWLLGFSHSSPARGCREPGLFSFLRAIRKKLGLSGMGWLLDSRSLFSENATFHRTKKTTPRGWTRRVGSGGFGEQLGPRDGGGQSLGGLAEDALHQREARSHEARVTRGQVFHGADQILLPEQGLDVPGKGRFRSRSRSGVQGGEVLFQPLDLVPGLGGGLEQASLLLETLTPEEREAIDKQELDRQIRDLAALANTPVGPTLRERCVSEAYATVNALPRLMDEVELDGMDYDHSLIHQLRLFLRGHRKRGWDKKFTDEELEIEADRILGNLDGDNKHEVSELLRLLSRLEVATRSRWNKRRPDFRLEKAFELSRRFAYGPLQGTSETDFPEKFAEEAAEVWNYEIAGAPDVERIQQIAEFWRLYLAKVEVNSIPF
jgi:hypothetical protein